VAQLWGDEYLLPRHPMLPASLGCMKTARAYSHLPFGVLGFAAPKTDQGFASSACL